MIVNCKLQIAKLRSSIVNRRSSIVNQKGFLLFEVMVGMGILTVTISAMLWSLTEGATSYQKLKTRLIAIKLLQERMESLDGRFDVNDIPPPIGDYSGSPLHPYYREVSADSNKDENLAGQLTSNPNNPPYVASYNRVALVQSTCLAPLNNFGFVERVHLVTPSDPNAQKTRLVLYKIRVEVYWPIMEGEYDETAHQFDFIDGSTGNLVPDKPKQVLTATTMLLRVLP